MYDPEKHHRRSIRLKDYDYSQAGAYFVPICTHNEECLFGEIVDGGMILNGCGVINKNEWLRTSGLRNNLMLDKYAVMPSYFHGIVSSPMSVVGARCNAPYMRNIWHTRVQFDSDNRPFVQILDHETDRQWIIAVALI